MNQPQLEALLGRPLSAIEITNRKLYLNIALEMLESLLCTSVTEDIDRARTFVGREGYRTVFTGIFTNVSEVKIDGTIVDPSEYYAAQWDNRNATWYNLIVFTETRGDCVIEVTADWGFTCLPNDLNLLLAQLFANVSKKYVVGPKVQSKQVEDFRITYATTLTDDQQFMVDNSRTLQKYSLCTVGEIRQGQINGW